MYGFKIILNAASRICVLGRTVYTPPSDRPPAEGRGPTATRTGGGAHGGAAGRPGGGRAAGGMAGGEGPASRVSRLSYQAKMR